MNFFTGTTSTMHQPPSLLENLLGRSSISLLCHFFHYWDAPTIFLLGQLNYRLRCIVKLYEFNTWNVDLFLMGWFHSSERAINKIKTAPAIFCGRAVMTFFDREHAIRCGKQTRLDICVGFEGIEEIVSWLIDCGYNFQSSLSNSSTKERMHNFRLALMAEVTQICKDRRRIQGDKSVTQNEHYSTRYKFLGSGLFVNSVIVVHLVRCELHRFIFAMHSSQF